MLEYRLEPEPTIDDLNNLASQGWKVVSFNKDLKNILLMKGTDPIVVETQQSILDLSQEKIISGENEFIVKKEITYGDVILFTFLTLFLVFGIISFLIKFLIPKLVNFRR